VQLTFVDAAIANAALLGGAFVSGIIIEAETPFVSDVIAPATLVMSPEINCCGVREGDVEFFDPFVVDIVLITYIKEKNHTFLINERGY